jgi:hypothetical protein
VTSDTAYAPAAAITTRRRISQVDARSVVSSRPKSWCSVVIASGIGNARRALECR